MICFKIGHWTDFEPFFCPGEYTSKSYVSADVKPRSPPHSCTIRNVKFNFFNNLLTCSTISSSISYDFSGSQICTISTLSNWCNRFKPLTSLPYDPASLLKQCEYAVHFIGRSLLLSLVFLTLLSSYSLYFISARLKVIFNANITNAVNDEIRRDIEKLRSELWSDSFNPSENGNSAFYNTDINSCINIYVY